MLGNNFEGFLPSSIGGMTNLRVFAGDGNSFNGTLPTEIGLCILLQELGLSSTDIASTIPTEFGMLQQLSKSCRQIAIRRTCLMVLTSLQRR